MNSSKYLLVLLLLSSHLYSQQNCQVLKNDINEEYQGECKKNLAHGNGTAKGINTYKGEFKNGYPHGQGVMIYKDESLYTGQWKKGERSGEGRYILTLNGKDSIADGIWKNDLFIGKKTINPYEVTRANSVPRYTIRKINDDFNKVTISIKNGGTPYPVSRNINGSSGNLVMSMGRAIFENITIFPFVCEMRYPMPTKMGSASYDAEFNFKILEKGEWMVELSH